MECALVKSTDSVQRADTPSAEAPSLPEIAGQLADLVTKMEALVPDFAPHDKRESSRVAAGARFAHELIGPTVTIVTAVPSMPQDLFKVDKAQEALLIRDQLRPIAQRLAAFTQGLDFTIDTKLSAAGEDALQTYHWAKRAALGPNGAALHPYLDEMRRVVKRAINRTPAKRKPATPAPQGQGFMAGLPQPAAEDTAAGAGELPESYYKVAEDA
jgi:hypothetical protein